MDGERLGELVETVGRKRLVLDLSCRKKVRCSSNVSSLRFTSDVSGSGSCGHYVIDDDVMMMS